MVSPTQAIITQVVCWQHWLSTPMTKPPTASLTVWLPPAPPPAVTVCFLLCVCHTIFPQGDACKLPAGLGRFDAVLAANLLCRVPDPQACLQGIAEALNPGGVLVLTSPFTWMEDYTAKSKWLGGRAGADGAPLRCADALKAVTAELGFTVLEEGKVGAGGRGGGGGLCVCVCTCAHEVVRTEKRFFFD